VESGVSDSSLRQARFSIIYCEFWCVYRVLYYPKSEKRYYTLQKSQTRGWWLLLFPRQHRWLQVSRLMRAVRVVQGGGHRISLPVGSLSIVKVTNGLGELSPGAVCSQAVSFEPGGCSSTPTSPGHRSDQSWKPIEYTPLGRCEAGSLAVVSPCIICLIIRGYYHVTGELSRRQPKSSQAVSLIQMRMLLRL
jgi:hypothetical protein